MKPPSAHHISKSTFRFRKVTVFVSRLLSWWGIQASMSRMALKSDEEKLLRADFREFTIHPHGYYDSAAEIVEHAAKRNTPMMWRSKTRCTSASEWMEIGSVEGGKPSWRVESRYGDRSVLHVDNNDPGSEWYITVLRLYRGHEAKPQLLLVHRSTHSSGITTPGGSKDVAVYLCGGGEVGLSHGVSLVLTHSPYQGPDRLNVGMHLHVCSEFTQPRIEPRHVCICQSTARRRGVHVRRPISVGFRLWVARARMGSSKPHLVVGGCVGVSHRFVRVQALFTPPSLDNVARRCSQAEL